MHQNGRDSAVFSAITARAWPASITDGSERLKVVDAPLLGWFWPGAAAVEAAVGVLLSGRGGLVAVAAVPSVLARGAEGASIEAGSAPLLAVSGAAMVVFSSAAVAMVGGSELERLRGRIF